MNGLNQIRDAVIAAIQSAGIAAIPAYEGAAKRYDCSVIAVDVASAEGKPVGLSSYLGQRYDKKTGVLRELHGMQMNVKILLDVRSIHAADCEAAMEAAAGAILKDLPSGLKLGEMRWTGIVWDKVTGMFLRKGTVVCKAAFIAEDLSEDGTLMDFILKGTIEN